MADNKQTAEQEYNDLEQSARSTADLADNAIDTAKDVGRNVKNIKQKREQKKKADQGNHGGSTGNKNGAKSRVNADSSRGQEKNSSDKQGAGSSSGRPLKGGSNNTGQLNPAGISANKTTDSANNIKNQKEAAKITGRAAGKTTEKVSKGIKKGLKKVNEFFTKTVSFAIPYLLIIVFVFVAVLVIILIAYTIAYRYKDVGKKDENSEYSYEWIAVESRELTTDEKKNNALIIYGTLKDEGYTANAIAAILGNIEWESSINPARWQDDDIGNTDKGYGLVQWTPATKIRNWLSGNGYEMDDGDGQLKWIIDNTKNDWQKWRDPDNITWGEFISSSKSARELARVYCKCFERGTWVKSRADYAESWYNWINDYGNSELSKIKRTSGGKFSITMDDILKCKSRQEYFDLVMPAYKEYGRQFGIKYPGILAAQAIREVGNNFPQGLSNVARTDNNLGGLKYVDSIPNATRGTSVPSNESGSNYCHFETVGDYIYAHCWQVGRSSYKNVREKTNVNSFAIALYYTWVRGTPGGTAPSSYSDELVMYYNQYGLSKYDN